MNELFQKDLAAFLEFYERNHICPFHFCSKVKIENFIKTYMAKNVIESDDDFVYFFRCMLKQLIGKLDSHTIIRTRDEYEHWPLKLEIGTDSEKVFVTATNKWYQRYFDREVVKINHVDIKTLLQESKQAISYSTEGWRKAETGRFLSSKSALRSLPSIDSNTNIISYTFSDGEEIEACSTEEYQQLSPENYSFDMDGDSLTLHFTACREEYPNQMQATVKQLQRMCQENLIKTFTLDLSGNMGGSDLVIRPLVEWLKFANLEIFVKVNRYVQSAGLFAINDMRRVGAKIIGNEIGSSMNHLGNNLRCELPSSRFLTIVATRYFYLDEDSVYHTVRTKEDFQKLPSSYICLKPLRFDV